MKKIAIISSLLVALCTGFFAVVPVWKSHAHTWYTVYEYTQRQCASSSPITNECVGEIIPQTVFFTPNTINLANHPTAACPLPPAENILSSGTPSVKAYKLTGSHASQTPGISCIVGPGI